MDRNCKDCVYFKNSDIENSNIGECRFDPPNVILYDRDDGGYGPVNPFPKVFETYFCGKFAIEWPIIKVDAEPQNIKGESHVYTILEYELMNSGKSLYELFCNIAEKGRLDFNPDFNRKVSIFSHESKRKVLEFILKHAKSCNGYAIYEAK